jgi:hypothetical protein
MSELKANKISPATLSDVVLGDSGDTFTIPAGATIVNSGTATGFGSTSASDLTSGTLPDARFPSTLPALNGSALTNLPSSTTDIKFLACLTSDQNNVTGNGAAWTTDSTTAWTVKYNTGAGFTNGTFTAPETGKYLIFFQMYISGISGSHTENNFYINTSNRNYSIGHENFANIYVTANVSYNLGPYMVVADMDAGDTATGYLAAYNGSKTIDMEGNGNSTSTSTYFGGALLA